MPPAPAVPASAGTTDDYFARTQEELRALNGRLEQLRARRAELQEQNAKRIAEEARQAEDAGKALVKQLENVSAEQADDLRFARAEAIRRLTALRTVQQHWDDEAAIEATLKLEGLNGEFSDVIERAREVNLVEADIAAYERRAKALAQDIERLRPVMEEMAHLKASSAAAERHLESQADVLSDAKQRQSLVEGALDRLQEPLGALAHFGAQVLTLEGNAGQQDAGELEAARADAGLGLRRARRAFLDARAGKPAFKTNAATAWMDDPAHADAPPPRAMRLVALEEAALRQDAESAAKLVDGLRPDAKKPLVLAEDEARTLLESAAFAGAALSKDLQAAVQPYRKKDWFKLLAPAAFAAAMESGDADASETAWTLWLPSLSEQRRGVAAAFLIEALRGTDRADDMRLEGLYDAGLDLADKDEDDRVGGLRLLEEKFSLPEIASLYVHAFATLPGKEFENDPKDDVDILGPLSHRLAPLEAYLASVGKESLRTFSRRGAKAKEASERVSSAFQHLFDDQLLAGRRAAPYLRLNYLLDQPIVLPPWTEGVRDPSQQKAIEEAKQEAGKWVNAEKVPEEMMKDVRKRLRRLYEEFNRTVPAVPALAGLSGDWARWMMKKEETLSNAWENGMDSSLLVGFVKSAWRSYLQKIDEAKRRRKNEVSVDDAARIVRMEGSDALRRLMQRMACDMAMVEHSFRVYARTDKNWRIDSDAGNRVASYQAEHGDVKAAMETLRITTGSKDVGAEAVVGKLLEGKDVDGAKRAIEVLREKDAEGAVHVTSEDQARLFSMLAQAQFDAGDQAGGEATVEQMPKGDMRDALLRDVAFLRQNKGDVKGALTILYGISDVHLRERGLEILAVDAAKKGDFRTPAKALSGVSERREALYRKVFDAMSEAGGANEAVELALNMRDADARQHALGGIASSLTEKGAFDQAREVTGRMTDDAFRKETVKAIEARRAKT